MELTVVAVACLGAAIMNVVHYVHINRLRRYVLALHFRLRDVEDAVLEAIEQGEAELAAEKAALAAAEGVA
ncbi:hypothetical protein [Methylobacterium sp. ID0610]|uniref:hypothetical protein n=1 Tax=Methylobacterium carpenticola TaxID=3344827 RepID=UPI0036BFB15E